MDLSSDESEDAEERLDHVHDIHNKRNGFERISMLVERSNASNNLAAVNHGGGSPTPESPRTLNNRKNADRTPYHIKNSQDGTLNKV
jgi:hypothetical protein